MGNGKSRTSSKSSSTKNAPTNNTGRPRPMPFKAGVTRNRTRYENGGNLCW